MLILVVDDDQEDLTLFCEAAVEIVGGIRFLEASDGMEALTMLTQTSVLPDYIFLDINMPKMNGKEFLTRAKKDARIKNIPVIMYSTTSQAKEIEECYKLGAYDFLIKPPTFEKLCSDLRSIFVEAQRSNKRNK
jgi:CheY-like chemotaxis protein